MSKSQDTNIDFDPFAHGEIERTALPTGPQREIWSAVKLGGDAASCAYNEAVTLVFKGALDIASLEACLATLVERHDALRATFSADGSTMMIAKKGPPPFERVDLREEPSPVAAYDALARKQVETPFDVVHGPLMHTTLARISESEHRLLLVLHHLVCDGWSFGVLVGELAQLYDARKRHTEPQLDPPESFADYAQGRVEFERSAEGKATLAHWVKQYQGAIPSLDLPLDRPRPTLRTYAAERLDYRLPPELVSRVRELAKQQGASLQQMMLTGFSTLLARLSNQWDVVVGLSAAGQASSGRPGLVGHCVSFLPIRIRLDPETPFVDALAAVKRTMLDALDHQDCTFGTLLENLSIARDPSRVPLSPVSFNVEQGFSGALLDGLEMQASAVPRAYEAFEIFANLVDRTTHISVETQYNIDLFDEETIRDWLESYEALLQGAVYDPKTPLRSLPVLTKSQEERLLHELNATDASYERDTPIHGFFEAWADRAPERTALAFEHATLSYGELEKRANRLAHHLRGLGVGPESIVGVCVPRSMDMVVAQLGILKAGGAYLPLDPSYPGERLKYMLEDAGAKLVVTRGTGALWEASPAIARLDLVTAADALEKEPTSRPARSEKAHNLAYVIYTSGSTGKPKGVLVEHHNFANFLAGMDQRLTLSEPGVWLNATSIGFDISLLEIFGALARGFAVVVHSDESGPEHGIAPLIERHAATHFQCTPSQARILVGDEAGRRAIAGLVELLVGGEALPVDLARELTALMQRGRLINMYGPTETTIWSTTQEVERDAESIVIGRPIANTKVYVLDEHGQPCARGAVGELYIGGEGVTRGYHARPELTAERFVRDPFAKRDGARMYKTGDLARLRQEGTVEFLGRNDHQVKLRGYRIELGEIELALRGHQAVREAVVLAREDRPGDKRLVAYLVCDGSPTVPELKAYLTQAGLPEYMLPQAFMTLPKLPQTPNGKLDRKALPAPEQGGSLSVGVFVAPTDELQMSIGEAWKQVLGLGRVGIDDNFFDLGGHSLLVVQLAEKVQECTGKTVSIPDLFRFPTVRSFATFLKEGGSGESGASALRGAQRRGAQRATQGRRG